MPQWDGIGKAPEADVTVNIITWCWTIKSKLHLVYYLCQHSGCISPLGKQAPMTNIRELGYIGIQLGNYGRERGERGKSLVGPYPMG